jgi:GT2 family glycosyltransferase
MERFQDIAVIVVNYGTADLAIAAVESVLARHHGGRSVSVHLVDNASPGQDAAQLRDICATPRWAGRVTFWPETENHGFGRGNNVVLRALAAQKTPPHAVFLLNPDARLENETIDILADTLEHDPRAAAVGAGICLPNGQQVTAAFRFPGPVNEIVRMVNVKKLDHLARGRLVTLPPDQPAGPVDWVSGASVMFRFGALRDVSFFDPGYFLYFEEVDLMHRLHDAGWGTLYEPRARVVHEEGAATGQGKRQGVKHRRPVYLYQSWTHYFSRFYGRFGALSLAVGIVPAACLNILHRRIRGYHPTLPLHFFSDHYRHVIRPLMFGPRAR